MKSVMWNGVRRWERVRLRLRPLRRDERGVTLVEQLVTMSILGLVVGALVTLFVSGSKAEFDLNLRYRAQQEARVALDAFRVDVHNACQASVSSGIAVTLMTVDQTNTSFPCTVTNSTWCTSGSGSRYGFYRVSGAGACNSVTGSQRADYLTSGSIFSTVSAVGLLPKVAIDMTVAIDPTVSRLMYHLQDAIVVRNAARA